MWSTQLNDLKKSRDNFLFHYYYLECYQYMIIKSWQTTVINNIESKFIPVTHYTNRVSPTSVLLTDNRNKGVSVALYTKSLSLVCNKRRKNVEFRKAQKKKPLQTRCNVVLGVSSAWGFTSILNVIYNNKEMIKTCILLNIQTRGLNPLTPGSDPHVTSPYNIHLLSSKQVMRIFSCIR